MDSEDSIFQLLYYDGECLFNNRSKTRCWLCSSCVGSALQRVHPDIRDLKDNFILQPGLFSHVFVSFCSCRASYNVPLAYDNVHLKNMENRVEVERYQFSYPIINCS